MAPIPVAAAIPAAGAALAYLNAKWGISNDISLFRAVRAMDKQRTYTEKTDTVNAFYALESWATSSTHANRVFMIFEGQQWTYAQAYEIVLRYATWLKVEKRVVKEEVVAIDFLNSPTFVWVWYGLWALGAKPAFINTNLTGTPLLHSVRESSARLLLVESELRDHFPEEVVNEFQSDTFRKGSKTSVELVFVDAEMEKDIIATAPARPSNEERAGQKCHDMAMLIYTSGTTGLPKPAVVSWNKARFAGWMLAKLLKFRDHEIYYTCMPLYHSSAPCMCISPALATGTTFTLGRKFSRATFWPEVVASNATGLNFVGEICRYLMTAPPSPLDRAHKVRFMLGNGLRADIWNRFRERFGIETILEFWGATEAPAAIVNLNNNRFTEGAVGYLGKLLDTMIGRDRKIVQVDIETAIIRRDPKSGFCIQCKPSEPGELVLKLEPEDIESKYQGYYGNSKASSSKIMRNVFKKGDAWFRSGDVFSKDSEGRWFFVDRIGDTFRWKSENVSTAEVGQVLALAPGVTEVNVYGVQLPNHDGRAGCAAVIFNGEPDEKVLAGVAAHALKELPRYAVPIFIRATKEFATTGTHKHLKNALRDEGADPEKVREAGDKIFWLQNGKYVPFTDGEWNRIKDAVVKL